MKKVDHTQLWKITDKWGRSYNDTQWGWGVTHASLYNQDNVILCSPSAIHAYVDPVLGVFLNPIHGNYDVDTMLVWESEGWIIKDDGTKVGCRELTTWNTVEFEIPNQVQRAAFGILSALEIKKEYKECKEWIKWAEKWLSGENRSEENRRNASAYASASASAYASASVSASASAFASAHVYVSASASARIKLNGPKIARQAMTII